MLVAVRQSEILGVVDLYFKTSFGINRSFLSIFIALWRRSGLLKAIRQALGLLNFRINPVDKRTAYVSTIGVKPGFQNQKIGEQLMRAAEDMARTVGCQHLSLYVITRNKRAIHLYSKLGFETLYAMRSSIFAIFNGFYGFLYMKKEIGCEENPSN